MPTETGPYLQVATFCEMVIESKTGVISLINVVDRYTINTVGPSAPEEMPPQRIPWTLVLTFRSGEARGSERLRITPEDPNGIKRPSLELPVHFEGGNRGFNVVLKVDFEARGPGVHWFWIHLDNQFVTKVPLEVIYSRVTFGQTPLGR